MCPVLTGASGLPAFEKTPRFCKKKNYHLQSEPQQMPTGRRGGGQKSEATALLPPGCLPSGGCSLAPVSSLVNRGGSSACTPGAALRTEESVPITGVAGSEAPKPLTTLCQGTRVVTSPTPLAPQVCAMGRP